MRNLSKTLGALALGALIATSALAEGVLGTLAKPVAAAKSGSAGEDSATQALTTTDYTDGWWIPAESGWGMNVLHQEGIVALTFYVYDTNNQPIWYLGAAAFVSDAVGYQGTLARSTGPFLGTVPFNPGLVTSNTVGNVTFRPTGPYDAVLTYNVGNTAVTKNVTRIAFNGITYAGSFFGGIAGALSGCASGNGPFEGLVAVTGTITNGNAQLQLQGDGASCTLSGTFQQRGRFGSVPSGTYSCTTGNGGTATIHEWDVNRSGMTARYTTLTNGCLESGRISAVRRN